MIKDIQEKIIELKKQKNTVILAHSYQAREITEVADETGDSYALSVAAKKYDCENFIMCGVHFMAETVKILSPDKHVYLAKKGAGCPMAEQMSKEEILKIKEKEPDRKVVAYINTTAELKTVCDVCVTSSSAVKICKAMNCKKILFIPDKNLGEHVRRSLPDTDVMTLNGGCPVHGCITKQELDEARAQHPGALVLVHPECDPSVYENADYIGSTAGIMKFAKESDKKDFIIGTETSIAEHLQYECPDKSFYPLSKRLMCPDMKLATLMDVYNTLLHIGEDSEKAFEIIMSDELISKAKKCIEKMIEYGG